MSKQLILEIVDYFFILLHSALILFNVFGWIVPRWRFANLITLSVTAFSWFVLGIWYGIGYCPFTDWHWKVRQLLGYQDESNSYIHFLILKIVGVNLPENWVETATLIVFLLAFCISIILNQNKHLLKRK
jgi:hydrogenase-4 membrane subunit HyfE